MSLFQPDKEYHSTYNICIMDLPLQYLPLCPICISFSRQHKVQLLAHDGFPTFVAKLPVFSVVTGLIADVLF